jgi:hypothetical protein
MAARENVSCRATAWQLGGERSIDNEYLTPTRVSLSVSVLLYV